MKQIYILILSIIISSCALTKKKINQEDKVQDEVINEEVEIIAETLEETEIKNFAKKEIVELIEKPLYKFEPEEIDQYLKFLYNNEPNLRKRIDHIAKKFLGQEYEIYLLGEFPFEIHDPQPLYSIDKSDCVVFSEHVYAMALSDSWKKFFAMLQRIRYKDGIIGLLTRNHFTEADWVVNNSWLVKDITDSLPEVNSVKVTTKIDRAKFFSKWSIGQDIPVQELSWSYIPVTEVKKALKYLRTGDFVNVVRGYKPDDVFVGHVGIISVGSDGIVYLIHSTTPEVVKEPLLSYMEKSLELNKIREKENEEIVKYNKRIEKYNESLRLKNNGNPHPDEKPLRSLKPVFYGFRFFSLREDALENLKSIDGPNAPRVLIYGNE